MLSSGWHGEVAPRGLVMVGLSVLQGLLKPCLSHCRGAVLTVHQFWILEVFWPQCVICRILVLQPGIELPLLVVKAQC